MPSTNIEISHNEQAFIDAYIDAIYFTDTGDIDQPESTADLCGDFWQSSVIDCLAFLNRCACYLDACEADYSQAGHDFWLTRNGHGVGFWDRPEIYTETYSEMFTKIAESFGESYAEFSE